MNIVHYDDGVAQKISEVGVNVKANKIIAQDEATIAKIMDSDKVKVAYVNSIDN